MDVLGGFCVDMLICDGFWFLMVVCDLIDVEKLKMWWWYWFVGDVLVCWFVLLCGFYVIGMCDWFVLYGFV